MVEIEVKDRGPTFEITTNAGIEEMGINLKDMLPNLFGQQDAASAKCAWPKALDYLVQEEEQKLIDMDQVTRVALERVESQRHHLPRRDRQDRRARSRPRPGRQPRRRAARHPAHRRRHHRQHALRFRAHRPHSVHRRRRVPRFQAQRPDSGAAGPLPHPRRAEIAHRGGFHPHPEGAQERAGQAVHRAAGDRGHQADPSPTTRSRKSPDSPRR